MNINPNQFKLFYSADELQHSLTDSGDRKRPTNPNGVGWTGEKESMDSMWSRKLDEAKRPYRDFNTHGSGTYDSIKSEGFRPHTKLRIDHDTQGGMSLGDGHHRLAAAADLDRQANGVEGDGFRMMPKPTGQQWINVEHTAPGMERANPVTGTIRRVGPPLKARYTIGADLLDLVTKAVG